MSTLATWSHVVQSRDVSPHNFDGLAMSGLAFSAAPTSRHLDLDIDNKCQFFVGLQQWSVHAYGHDTADHCLLKDDTEANEGGDGIR